ncbi:chromate transporter [Sutcliffiella cohnii]|uniref:Chromate transporter n=1 Tax=Sutcliffiella cohnii TaxID=33932 RepID=A0A223KW76_9BACI|nr:MULTISPECIES: chromate transporter [Sutcliffiella]AST93716.1 chromate transporter [Sutcliffiella cohnii]MED4015957.1 chromate transporter [Sutcliffiella cohnii]WBL14910.1 chromate transporter [Sutcliffiella sp. NC1]
MKQWHIFIAFFRSGMLGYGGGPSSIPLVHKEVVERFKWLTDDEFSDVLALGNTLPGPINTKMAGYIGYRVGGVLGMLNAIFASIMPTILLMIVILTTLTQFKDNPVIQGMTKAVVPVVGVMLAVLTWDFFKNSKKGLGLLPAIILVVASLLLIEMLGLHPGILIGVLLAAAFFKKDKQPEKGGESA